MRLMLLLAGLVASLAVTRASQAEERRVVVLIPRRLPEPWPEGTQAVIAELAAGEYQVLVASSRATTPERLAQDLEREASRPATAGAVAIVRNGSTGVAYVRTRRDAEVVMLEAEVTERAVAEGSLALRVTELLRRRDLDLPEAPAEPEALPSPRPAHREAPAPAPAETAASKALVWIGPGLAFTSHATRPLTSLDVGAQVGLWQRLAIGANLALSLVPLRIETEPGRVSLSARQLTAHLLFQIFSSASASVALGAGGGALWIEQSGDARAGFIANSESLTVGLLSAAARGALHTDRVTFLLAAEPGLTLPAVSVRAGDTELAMLGRPWVLVALGVGWNL